MKNNDLETLRALTLREYTLFYDRTNVFLVCQSILMAGMAIGRCNLLEKLPLSFLGVLICLIWMYISHRTLITARYYENLLEIEEKNLNDNEQIYTNCLKWRREIKRPIFGIRVSCYIGFIMPIIWILGWIFFAIFNFCIGDN